MGHGLRGYWKTAQHLFSKDESATRKKLLALTEDFLDAQDTAPETTPPANDKPYSIYAMNRALGFAGIQHSYMRFVDGDGRVICDIHGLREVEDGEGYLKGLIEPTDFEYFSKLEATGEKLLWQGSASDAGIKMHRAFEIVDELNEKDLPYNLLFQSCNSLFHRLIDELDLDMPELPWWTPGISSDVDDISQDTHPLINGGAWMAQAQTALTAERAAIAHTIAGP
jgi:hypothetical protein